MPCDELGNIETSVTYFKRKCSDKNVEILDIGTHYGSFLESLHRLGYKNITGIDLDDKAIRTGREMYPLLKNNLQAYDGSVLPFKDSSFDVVSMFDVLEHIPLLGQFLSEQVWRVLRPNGLLVFQTPNILINVPKEIIYHRSLTEWRKFHCSLQTLTSLRNLLLSTNFDDITIEKNEIKTEHNIRLIRNHLGPLGPGLLALLNRLPLFLFPNFWGCALKRNAR